MQALIQLKNALAVLFAAFMAAGAFYGAVKGLVQGDLFCLLCKRGSAPAPLAATPTLFVISELMLLGLGAVCLAGAVYGLRDLRRPDSDDPEDGPTPPRRPMAPRQPGSAPSVAARMPAPAAPAATAPRQAHWQQPSRRPPPPKPSPWAGLLVHLLAALCMLATLVLGVLAMTTDHSSTDLGFGVLLLWLMPIGSFFWGSAFLAMSPRPGVSRVGRWLLVLMFGAGVLLSLFDKLR